MAYNSKNDILIEELKKIKADFRAKIIRPYYFLYGDEHYLIDETLDRIKKIFIDDTGLNYKIYTANTFNIEDAIKYIISFPLMNDKKLIVFKDIPFFRLKNKSDSDAGKVENFINAIKENVDQNIIVILDHINSDKEPKYEKYFDNANSIAKFIKEKGVLLNIHKFDDETLGVYVVQRFKKANKEINKLDASYIVRNIGSDLENLYNECDKIISYLGERTIVERIDIDNVLTRSIDNNIFNMIYFINNNKPSEALKLYGDLLSSGEDSTHIAMTLASNYKNLTAVKGYMEKSKTKNEIASLMGLAPWQVERLMTASKYTSSETFKEKLNLATKLSVAVSTGNMDEKLISEILFLK